MNSEIVIRQIVQDDLKSIYQFVCELEDEQFDFDLFSNVFKENIENPDFLYNVAIYNNQSVGFISFHTQNLLHHCGVVGEIQELYVDKAFRGKGVGRLLVNSILDFSNTMDVKSIEVTSNKMRSENIQFYENLGFELTHNKFTISCK